MQQPTSHQPVRGGALSRLADSMFIHRKRVVLGWIVVLALAVVAVMSFGGTYTADYSTPGSDSKAASDRLEEKFAGRSGDAIDIVWKSADGAQAPAVTDRIDRLLEQAEKVEGVMPGTTARDAQLAPDGRTAVVRLPLARPASAVETGSGEQLRGLVERAGGDGVEVAANGRVPGLVEPANMSAEVVGIAVAALVLLVTFGAVVAAGLPLLVALFGVVIAATLGGVLAAVLDTPD